MSATAVVVFMAFVVEGIVEYFIGPLLEPLRPTERELDLAASPDVHRDLVPIRARTYLQELNLYQLGMRYSALILGVALSLAFHLNLFVGLPITVSPTVAAIVTGVLMGRGSNYLHDLLGKR